MNRLVAALGGLAGLLLLASFLFTPNDAPLPAGYLELFGIAAAGVLAVAAGLLGRAIHLRGVDTSGVMLLLLAILVPAGAIALDMVFRPHPYPMLPVSTVLVLVAAAVVALTGFALAVASRGSPTAGLLLKVIGGALALAAALNALFGLLQYLQVPAPTIIVSELVVLGRSYGNLRQPNLYVLLVCWGYLAGLAMLGMRMRDGQPVGVALRAISCLIVLFVAVSVAVSGSRSGGLYLWVIGVAGVLLPGLSLFQRVVMLAVPVLHAVAWACLVALDLHEVLPFYSTLRSFRDGAAFDGGDISNSRFGVWRDAIAMVLQKPWLGHGFYRLNEALLLGPSSNTVLLNFIHAHNLFIHWAFEFGIPMVILWTSLVGWWAWRIRAALVSPMGMWLALGLVLIFLGNMLEHPWWHPHLLLPSAFAAGALSALGVQGRPARADMKSSLTAPSRPLLVSGLLMVAIAFQAASELRRLAPVYRVSDAQTPLTDRLAGAYATLWFTHWVDQAVVGTLIPVTMESADVQCRLGKKVQSFFLGEYAALNTALACAQQGELLYAAKLVARVQADAPHVVQAYKGRLSEAHSVLFAQLVQRADEYKRRGL